MRASYIPLYYGTNAGVQGPLQALLVNQSFSVHDKFIEVVVTDRVHILERVGRYKPKRVMARVVQVAFDKQRPVAEGKYAVFVRPK